MHIKVFDNFSLGKLGGKVKGPPEKDAKAAKMEEKGKKKNGKDKKTADNGGDLNDLAPAGDITKVLDTAPVRPHGPAKELSLDGEDQENAGILLDEVEINDDTKLGGEIKVAEVNAEKAAVLKSNRANAVSPPPAVKAAPAVDKPPAPAATASPPPAAAPATTAEKKDAKPEENDLKNLFSTDEEEENPLASLINTLPDVTVQELLDDLAEIQRIIKEWRPAVKNY